MRRIGGDGLDSDFPDQAAEKAAQAAKAANQVYQTAHSVQAAQAAIGAAGSGGASAGATVGAAAGGPLGAVIAAVVTSKTFWKFIGALLVIMFLVMYIVANLLSLVLSYIGFGSPDDYVSQARQAELLNLQTRIEAVLSQPEAKNEVLSLIEGKWDAILEEIEADFDGSGCDEYEIIRDEYEEVLVPQLSRYLAVMFEEKWNGSQIRSFGGYGGSDSFSTDLTSEYDAYFELAAATYDVSVSLLKAMAKTESDFNPNAVSHAGAIGIMQLMPATARELGVTDPYDPQQNIMGGAKYIAAQIKAFSAYSNGLELAIAAYNAGGKAVRDAGYRIPQNGETPAYVAKVMALLGGGGDMPDGGIAANPSDSVSLNMMKATITSELDTFFGWNLTRIREVTISEGEGEEKTETTITIAQYSILLKLNRELSETSTGYEYRYVTSRSLFNLVVKLLQAIQDGTRSMKDILFQMFSWKEFITGVGASEDGIMGDIDTAGDAISYETVSGCVKEVVYYNQGEEPWKSMKYGSSTIGSAGCGPTAMAIVISTLTGETVTPKMTADYSIEHGEYVSGQGTSHSFPRNAALHWGLTVKRVGKNRMSEVVQSLKQGKLVVVICAPNTISGSSGHYIVLTGVNAQGYITIADPGSRSRTGKVYSVDTIHSYGRDLDDGAFWIIGT
ncbi:transglycosylase SLT domain-containing protein [Lachnoclostridium pacaense]|uniref:transglycosylase SLT domain-containing protein n=1 Tax=Enterocloster hominis (ex Hitch et al. 2024) TaxID=1917870 RepID=UPI001D0FB723|nr:transglycosylase SLT domain-containing protein [Lachnoclostridium pacaense]MCC2817281.1 transglycosylase SLT domain-containing protein [Lachnoclostridium pacaense]